MQYQKHFKLMQMSSFYRCSKSYFYMACTDVHAGGLQLSFFPRWLCNETLPPTSRRWAIEGLAYLTLDADVKVDLVEDKKALQAMFELAKVSPFALFWRLVIMLIVDICATPSCSHFLCSLKTKPCCMQLDRRWLTAPTAMMLRSQTLRWWN